jgi:SGNH hydrolase-like domain, acetyltransferase AlgX
MAPSQNKIVAGAVAAHLPRRGGPTDPSHDEDLRRGILVTTVSRPVAGVLVFAFLLLIAAVPVGQAVRDKVNGDEAVLLDLFRHAPTKDNIKQFEEDLDKASTAREYVRPRMQAVLTRWGGFGNTKAVIGRDGWLFYAPGVTSVGGPGFLNRAIIESRKKAALDAGDPAIFPDPRPAILDFGRYLAGRGIKLVVFPVPDKASLQPFELHGRELRGLELHGRNGDAGRRPGRNVDAARLTDELRAAGILVFDPSPDQLARGAPPYFLRQDTHWTPEWMEIVADRLAQVLPAAGAVGPATAPGPWRAVAKTVTRVGDVTDMLGLPEGQTLFAPQSVTVHEVHDQSDKVFEPNERADVLLLGDSFTNVFSLEQMGWGAGAGFGAQLARALGRDVDVIAQNDSGAYATRQLLFNALTGTGGDAPPGAGDRLTGKKIVIWEFASRELAVGNWKPIDWSRGKVAHDAAGGQEPAP